VCTVLGNRPNIKSQKSDKGYKKAHCSGLQWSAAEKNPHFTRYKIRISAGPQIRILLEADCTAFTTAWRGRVISNYRGHLQRAVDQWNGRVQSAGDVCSHGVGF